MESTTPSVPSQPTLAYFGMTLFKDGHIELATAGDMTTLRQYLGLALDQLNNQLAA